MLHQLITIYRRQLGRQRAKKLLDSGLPILLDLGAGTKAHPGFIGLDLESTADICCNLTEGIPFPNESVDKIRSDHFFEHLRYKDVMFVLKECYRVLKKQGTIDITVPCFDVYLDAYLSNDTELISREISDIPDDLSPILRTPFDKIMWVLVRDGEHKSFFDAAAFCAKLVDAGFLHVEQRSYNPQIDTEKRFSSLYVRGHK